jgi:nucleoside-diphosphate-sugar epimerase
MSISQINYEAEEVGRAAAARGELDTIVVRPGMVYGNGSWFREMAREIRSGTYRYVGDGANHLSPVHREDTGQAFRAIAERGVPGSTYLVVDDAPVSTLEFSTFLAGELKAPAPSSIRSEDAGREWGPEIATLNAANRSASNTKLRSLGWVPRFPTYRTGVPGVVEELQFTSSAGG